MSDDASIERIYFRNVNELIFLKGSSKNNEIRGFEDDLFQQTIFKKILQLMKH
jgi:hypothetical protein